MAKNKKKTWGWNWSICIVEMYIFLVFFLITMLASLSNPVCWCVFSFQRKKLLLTNLVWLALFSPFAMALVNKLILWTIIWAFSSFFLCSSPHFLSFIRFCVFLSIPDVSPQLPAVCSYRPSVRASFLPLRISPMHRSLSGRPVRLQELCEWSPGCQSKGWSLHSDQCHDGNEPLSLALSLV